MSQSAFLFFLFDKNSPNIVYYLLVCSFCSKMAYNGSGIAEGGVLMAQSFYLAQMYIKCTNVLFSTSAPLLAISC